MTINVSIGCRKPNLKRHADTERPPARPDRTPESRKTGSVILPGEGGLSGTLFGATELKIGYAQLSTVDQDLTVQREALAALGVDPKRICVDHGLTGTNRERPGLRQALAACHGGDMLVVTKLDRLARSYTTSLTNSPPAVCLSISAAT